VCWLFLKEATLTQDNSASWPSFSCALGASSWPLSTRAQKGPHNYRAAQAHSAHGRCILPLPHGDFGSISNAIRRLLEHLFVEADGLPGDSGPAEGLFYAPPPSISEALAAVGILKQSIDLEGKIPRKLFGISGKTCNGVRIEWNQVPCFSVNDDFFNPSCSACNHGRAAGHRFEVDDSERFVD
jgi:hypothetical protein